MAAYSSSCLMKIEFQHCGIVGIFVAFVIEDAHAPFAPPLPCHKNNDFTIKPLSMESGLVCM